MNSLVYNRKVADAKKLKFLTFSNVLSVECGSGRSMNQALHLFLFFLQLRLEKYKYIIDIQIYLDNFNESLNHIVRHKINYNIRRKTLEQLILTYFLKPLPLADLGGGEPPPEAEKIVVEKRSYFPELYK